MAFDLDDDELRETRKMKNLDRELTAGEYVRTKDGKIGIFKGYNNNRKSQWACKVELPEMKLWKYYEEENIVKHSKQLIGLIEVGDIVKDKYNKYEVAFVKDDKIYCNDYNLDDSLITLREQDIKAILTKEQYLANCYKVGGE